MRRMLLLGLALIAVALTPQRAAALTYEDVKGIWCGTETNYEFRRDLLTVTWRSDGASRAFPVDSYDYNGDSIVLHWRRDRGGDPLTTEFTDFVGDTMIQAQSDAGPQRNFHRCRGNE